MNVSVTWYGHSNFQISCDGVSVLIDPFFTHNPSAPVTWNAAAKPDLVLVTHDHGDHVGDAVDICKATGALCGCVVGTGERLVKAGLPESCLPAGMGFNIGGSIEVQGIRVTMTQAFHSSESGVPTGFVVTMPGGFTVYHAGDTGLFSSMELIGSLALSAGPRPFACRRLLHDGRPAGRSCGAPSASEGGHPDALGDVPGHRLRSVLVRGTSGVRRTRRALRFHEARRYRHVLTPEEPMPLVEHGELVRRAVEYVEEERKSRPDVPLARLLDEAGMRFNLSPLDGQRLSRVFEEPREQAVPSPR